MMILWLKQSDTWKWKQSDTCVNGGLLNDDILIKTKWYLVNWFIEWWYLWLKQSGLCVNGGLLTLIKTKWYLEIKTKWYLCQ